jgi:hypothetical protein
MFFIRGMKMAEEIRIVIEKNGSFVSASEREKRAAMPSGYRGP